MLKKVALTCLLVTVCLCATAVWAADGFTLCKSKYALCTTAKCTPIPGQKGQVSCPCDVKTGYSASQKACEDRKVTSTGQLKSRYFPVKYYAVCSNDRPWAWCLDKACTVDKDNPSKASCACTLVKDQGPYVVVVDKYNDRTCTTHIWSSATVQAITQITDFLKTQDKLKPFPIKVVNSQDQK
ncbi:MAG: hypothetical protein WA708_19495 [Acidobacteriaceae bacterium]